MGFADDVNRIIDKGMKEIVEREMHERATDMKRTAQAIFDRLVRDHGGKSVDECVPHVRAAFDEAGLTADDDEEIRRRRNGLGG